MTLKGAEAEMFASESSVFAAVSTTALEVHPISYASHSMTEAEVLNNLEKLGFQTTERDNDVLCLQKVTQ